MNLTLNEIRDKVDSLKKTYTPQIMSILYGSLLGDLHAERRINAAGLPGNTRFTFKQGSPNIQYLLHNWHLFSRAGLCTDKQPSLKPQVGKKGKEYHAIKFNTYTRADFNFVHDLFYTDRIKNVPCYEILKEIIDPLALATWIMDDGSLQNTGGLLLHTNSFSIDGVNSLRRLFLEKYQIKSNLRVKPQDEPLIYIPLAEMEKVRNLVKHHFSQDMMRKLYKTKIVR